MKSLFRNLLVASLLLVQLPKTAADVLLYDHDVDHGNLTLIREEGLWDWWTTDYPIVGGWMSRDAPISTGNGPNGSLWYHVIQGGREWGAYGVWDTPITLDQFYNRTGLNISIGWGIWWVYGENKLLGYNVVNHLAPPDLPPTYLLSYSASVIPEPSTARLFLPLLPALLISRAIARRQRANESRQPTPGGRFSVFPERLARRGCVPR